MKRMILIDGNSLMYRAYFGIADTSTLKPNSKGVFTNAIMSFARMMNHILQEQFDNILVAFDAGKHTFRHDIMTDYKAGRAHMPEEMPGPGAAPRRKKKTDCVERTRCRQSKTCSGFILPGACGFGK